MQTIKNWFHYLAAQIEWLKSFLSEPKATEKASSKRLISLSVVAAFLFSYIKVSLTTNKIEDIPTMWAFMIAGILGLNIVDWYVKKNPKGAETKEPPPGHPTGG